MAGKQSKMYKKRMTIILKQCLDLGLDLNDNEHVWDLMKRRYRSLHLAPRTRQHLRNALANTWNKIIQQIFGFWSTLNASTLHRSFECDWQLRTLLIK